MVTRIINDIMMALDKVQYQKESGFQRKFHKYVNDAVGNTNNDYEI